MGSFRILETREFLWRLEALEPSVRGFVGGSRKQLFIPSSERGPFFGRNIRKLEGFSPEVWRYRLGDYRLFYAVTRKKVWFTCSPWNTGGKLTGEGLANGV